MKKFLNSIRSLTKPAQPTIESYGQSSSGLEKRADSIGDGVANE
jgi:hypothetical protein